MKTNNWGFPTTDVTVTLQNHSDNDNRMNAYVYLEKG